MKDDYIRFEAKLTVNMMMLQYFAVKFKVKRDITNKILEEELLVLCHMMWLIMNNYFKFETNPLSKKQRYSESAAKIYSENPSEKGPYYIK